MTQEYDYPEFYEHPQLHQAALMRLILRAAAVRAYSRMDLIETIRAEIARVDRLTGHHASPVGKMELAGRVYRAGQKLEIAGLLQEMEDGSCRLTGSGRQILSENPEGLDESILMSCAGFQEAVHKESNALPGKRHLNSRDSGHAAFGQGQAVTDNPYPYDSAAHFSWSEGWYEASDESQEHGS